MTPTGVGEAESEWLLNLRHTRSNWLHGQDVGKRRVEQAGGTQVLIAADHHEPAAVFNPGAQPFIGRFTEHAGLEITEHDHIKLLKPVFGKKLFAERGGIDFLVALNVGRLRSQGLPSISCMLPFAAANELVMDFVDHELTRPVRVPVFVGLSPLEPHRQLLRRLDAVQEARLTGVANFPTAVHYPDDAARSLEAADRGFSAELGLLVQARARRLQTLVYVRSRAQAEEAAAIRPDILCVNFGWNAGGRLSELQPEVSIDEAILLARDIVRIVQAASPQTLCLIEGGPVVHPRQVAEICVEAGMQGYIGGSTIDRLPIEDAVVDATLAFKSAGLSRQQEEQDRSGLLARAAAAGLHGGSEPLLDALQRLRSLADGSAPLVVSGPAGSQRHAAVAFACYCAGHSAGATTLLASDHADLQLGIRLFGLGENQPGLVSECDGRPLTIEPLLSEKPLPISFGVMRRSPIPGAAL